MRNLQQFEEVVVPIVGNVNTKTFRIALICALIGLLGLLYFSIFHDVGTLRTIGGVLSLILMALPFLLRFFIPEFQNIGRIRFSEFEILVKMDGTEAQVFLVSNIDKIEWFLQDYEGETRFSDVIVSSAQLQNRTGAENQVSWSSAGVDYQFQFKLRNELELKKAKYFMKLIKSSILNRSLSSDDVKM